MPLRNENDEYGIWNESVFNSTPLTRTIDIKTGQLW